MTLTDTLDLLLATLRDAACPMRRVRDGCYRGLCPAHGDKRPSLSVTATADRILLHCFAGCPAREVIRSLGWRWDQLFVNTPKPAAQSPRIVEVYRYQDAHGVVVAEKVRYHPKAFKWRRPGVGGTSPHWGLAGRPVSLYRLPALVDSRETVVVEGEKTVDRLVTEGCQATCPPHGAGSWSSRYVDDLWCMCAVCLVVIGDNDREGQRHALHVAGQCDAYRPDGARGEHDAGVLRVKLLALPGLPPGGDPFDWFSAGHSGGDLRALIEATPYWTVAGAARAKKAHQRRLNRDRQRSWRVRHPTPRKRPTSSSSENAA